MFFRPGHNVLSFPDFPQGRSQVSVQERADLGDSNGYKLSACVKKELEEQRK